MEAYCGRSCLAVIGGLYEPLTFLFLSIMDITELPSQACMLGLLLLHSGIQVCLFHLHLVMVKVTFSECRENLLFISMYFLNQVGWRVPPDQPVYHVHGQRFCSFTRGKKI